MRDNRKQFHVLAALALATTIAGCGGGAGDEDAPTPLRYYVYECEDTGRRFGVPIDAEVYPPIVCPETGKRTAVRAHFFVPKGGDEPELSYYTKYTDEQIRRMEAYRNSADPEQLEATPPAAMLNELGEYPLKKEPGSDRWLTWAEQQRRPAVADLKERKYPWEVVPKGIEVVDEDQIKQW